MTKGFNCITEAQIAWNESRDTSRITVLCRKIMKVCNGTQGNIYLGIDDRELYETELQGMKDIKCNKKRINSAGVIKEEIYKY